MCFDYDDYPELHSASNVKCRKEHRCTGCRRKIRKGETAEHNTGKFDGSFYSYYVCDGCQRMILAIAAKEIQEGCPWSTAWCAVDDLREYLSELRGYGETIRPLGLRTIDDCRRYVNCLWDRAQNFYQQADSLFPMEAF